MNFIKLTVYGTSNSIFINTYKIVGIIYVAENKTQIYADTENEFVVRESIEKIMDLIYPNKPNINC